MARNWPHLPQFQSKEEAVAFIPDGWGICLIEEAYEKLDTGKLFDQKTSFPSGRVPVLAQSADGVVGFHNEEPGVNASPETPVVTFANHTCEMRVMRKPFSVIQNVFPMVGRPGVCETDFFYYATKGRVYLEEYKGHFPDYRRLWIPLPPLPTQRAIAHVLGTLDDLIELNRETNEILEEMARALFKSWFVDFDPVRAKLEGRPPAGMDAETAKLFPDHFQDSELGEIPKGWENATIGDICEINSWTLGKNDKLQSVEYVEISEVNQGNIANMAMYLRGDEPSRARRRLRHGDTVLSTVRPDRGAYFLALNPPVNRIASTGFAVLTPSNAPWSFVHAAMTQPEISDHLGHLADGGAYPAVRPEIISGIEVTVPNTPAILDAFQQVCAPLFEMAESNRLESRDLATLRDTLLPKLLSGEVSVEHVENRLTEIMP